MIARRRTIPRDRPTWAILTPASLDALERLVADDDEDMEAEWRLVRGAGRYHAVVDDEPGTEHTGEREAALALSRDVPGRHYVLYFDESLPWVTEFEGGALVADHADDPEALARRLGCPLIAAPAPEAADSSALPTRNALVVIGVSPERTAAGFGVPMPGPRGPLHLVAVPRGTLAWSTKGSLGSQAEALSATLGTTIYDVSRDPDPDDGFFSVRVLENGEERGRFELPPDELSDEDRIDAVEGETTPEGIARALGIPW